MVVGGRVRLDGVSGVSAPCRVNEAAGVGPESACTLSVSTVTRIPRASPTIAFPVPPFGGLSQLMSQAAMGPPDHWLTGFCFQQCPALGQKVLLRASVFGSSQPREVLLSHVFPKALSDELWPRLLLC